MDFISIKFSSLTLIQMDSAISNFFNQKSIFRRLFGKVLHMYVKIIQLTSFGEV